MRPYHRLPVQSPILEQESLMGYVCECLKRIIFLALSGYQSIQS
jgi:hypothetical protein